MQAAPPQAYTSLPAPAVPIAAVPVRASSTMLWLSPMEHRNSWQPMPVPRNKRGPTSAKYQLPWDAFLISETWKPGVRINHVRCAAEAIAPQEAILQSAIAPVPKIVCSPRHGPMGNQRLLATAFVNKSDIEKVAGPSEFRPA